MKDLGNGRLMDRKKNIEDYIRRIGRLEDFSDFFKLKNDHIDLTLSSW